MLARSIRHSSTLAALGVMFVACGPSSGLDAAEPPSSTGGNWDNSGLPDGGGAAGDPGEGCDVHDSSVGGGNTAGGAGGAGGDLPGDAGTSPTSGEIAVTASEEGRTGTWWCANHFGANVGGSWDCIDVSGGGSCETTTPNGGIVSCKMRGPGDSIINVGENSAPGRTGSWWCTNHFQANVGGIWDCLEVVGSSCADTPPNGADVLCRRRDLEVWLGPTLDSAAGPVITDFKAAFEGSAPWPNARQQTTVFKTYSATIAALLAQHPDWVSNTMAAQLQYWGMGLAVEVAGATGASCNAERLAILAQEESGVAILQAKGVAVRALVMDSPLWRFVPGDPGVCAGHSLDRAISDIVRYMKAMRAAFPNVQLGLTDPVPNRLLSPATLDADLAGLRVIYQKAATALAAEGLLLDFVQLDHSQHYRAFLGFPDWKHLVAVEDMLRYDFRVSPHVIFNDGSNLGNADYRAQTLRMLDGYLEGGGRPAGYVMQSWFPFPDFILPESDENSHAGLVLGASANIAAASPAP